MKHETRSPMPHQTAQSDYREVLTAIFGLSGPETGAVEWLLDRIEGVAEVRTWA